MRKRKFLKTLSLGSLGLAATNLVPSSWSILSCGRRVRARKHWAWITTDLESSIETWQGLFATMREAGVDALLPEIYDGRHAYYARTHLPVARPWLEEILPVARAEGFEVHAWMWSLPCNIVEMRQRHPDWFVVNRKGESAADKPAYVDYYKFLCPSHPEVHEFLRTIVMELCAYDALDGVHLDYIRYPDVILPEALQPHYGLIQDREYPEFDYCYCDRCRRDFQQEGGVDPMEIEDPTTHAAWRQFRYNRITDLVNNTLVPVARSRKKAITAAVFPNWANVRQQWPVWKIDGVLPMLYHTLYKKNVDWIREETEKAVQSLEGPTHLYGGILVSELGEEELARALEAALAGGADGVAIFHAQAMTERHWERFRRVAGAWQS